jgi:hypothetical protein
VLAHSSTGVPAASGAAASSGAGAPSEGRDWRGWTTVEETMRLLAIEELLQLTRVELYDLWRLVANELPKFSGGSRDRLNALTNLLNIRFALSRRKCSS